jgi:hypothetical protein
MFDISFRSIDQGRTELIQFSYVVFWILLTNGLTNGFCLFFLTCLFSFFRVKIIRSRFQLGEARASVVFLDGLIYCITAIYHRKSFLLLESWLVDFLYCFQSD